MTASDTIAQALFGTDDFGYPMLAEWDAQYPNVRKRYHDKADAILSALTAAGYRIVGPADMEKAVARLKDAVEGECDGLAIDDAQAYAILEYVFTGEPPK